LALVFFKALARDVPVITHGYHVSRFVLQHEGNLTDLSKRAPWPSRTIEALQNRRRTLRGVRVYGTSDVATERNRSENSIGACSFRFAALIDGDRR